MLGPCLASLQGLVDEIVVVDTGSVDDTVAIATSYGARVVHHPWTDDFAAARNVALEHVTAEWVLYIDADERVIDGDRTALESALTATDAVAFRVWLRPSLDSTPYREYRVWRNDPRIRFEGVIHEQVVSAIHEVADTDGATVELLDLFLQHVGYEGDQTRKHHRNLPLLRVRLEQQPDNLFVHHHLARVLDGLDRADEAEAVLVGALEVARRTGHPYGALVYTDLVVRRRARAEPVTELLAEGRRVHPDNLVLAYLEGDDLIDHERYDEAAACFKRILATDTSRLPPDSPSYEERLFGDLTLERLALALFRAGRYAESAAAYAAAEAADPARPEYAIKRQLAERRAASGGGAQPFG